MFRSISIHSGRGRKGTWGGEHFACWPVVGICSLHSGSIEGSVEQCVGGKGHKLRCTHRAHAARKAGSTWVRQVLAKNQTQWHLSSVLTADLGGTKLLLAQGGGRKSILFAFESESTL